MKDQYRTALSWCRIELVGAGCLLMLFAVAGAAAQENQDVAALRSEIAALRSEYEARIGELERRLSEIEAGAEAPKDDLQAIREAAREATAAAPEVVETGTRRDLNRLNPEISFTGNALAVASDRSADEFEMQEVEVDLQAALDPYSRTRVTLAVGEDGDLDLEEAYVVYPALRRGLGLTVGKFRQTFGVLNRQHLHALPQADYPLAITTFFGDEGLAQTGLSLQWLLPGARSTHELTVQATDGRNDLFGGEPFDRLSVLGHLKSFWELSDATWVEWGLSGISGPSPSGGGSNRVWGTDLSLHWQPPRRAKYRELTWRTEVLLSEANDPLALRRQAWGGYSYVEGLLRRNLSSGLRYDYVEEPLDPSLSRRAWVPYLSWWQSEFVRLRAELQLLDGDLREDENRFLLQMTWAAGPHKHEVY